MSEAKGRKQKITMKMVKARGQHRTGSRRKPPEVKVHATGRSEVNVAGTELVHELARRSGLDVQTYNLAMGYDAETGQVGLYPVAGGTPGSARIRRNKDRTAVVYLYDIFDEEPSLRPLTTRNCEVVLGTDEEGVECLLVGMNSSLRVGTSKTGAEESQAPAKKPARANGKAKSPEPGSASVAASSQSGSAEAAGKS